MSLDIGPGQIAFQKESTEVGEGIDIITVSDISAGEFNAAMNIGILFAVDQRSHRLGCSVRCLHLNGKQGACCSDEEVLSQGRIIPLIVVESVSRFDQRFANDIFVKRTLIDPEILVGS